MPSIYSYQKHIDTQRTVELRLPTLEGESLGTELATIDGVTYVSIPDDHSLPQQPTEIVASVQAVELTPSLREAIKSVSPHCKLISQRMVDQIRGAYSLDDEMYFARIGVGAAIGMYEPSQDELQEMTVFGEYVESVRQWGREEREKLGL